MYLPLKIRSLLPVAPALRYASVLPPLPVGALAAKLLNNAGGGGGDCGGGDCGGGGVCGAGCDTGDGGGGGRGRGAYVRLRGS